MTSSQSDRPIRPAALVTGGAVRLGRAIALDLAAAGYDIALHYGHSAPAANETAEAIRALGRDCYPVQQDLTDAEALPTLVARAREALPGLSLLINSASAYQQAPISTTTVALFDQQLAVNLRAPFFLTQAFALQVGQGQVINIIDNKIAFNQFQYAAYLLAKQALADFTRMAAVECAPGLRVNGIAPGVVLHFTRMAAVEFAPGLRVNGIAPGVVLPAVTRSAEYIAWRVAGIPVQRQGRIEDVTQAVRYLLAATFVTGQILTIDGGESLTNIGQNAAQFDPKKV